MTVLYLFRIIARRVIMRLNCIDFIKTPLEKDKDLAKLRSFYILKPFYMYM